MVPRKRLAAVVALLLVGIALSQSFAVATSTSSLESTYGAEEVTADSPPGLVASYDPDVVNLAATVNETPQLREPVATAARTGRYDGDIEPEAYMTLSDVNEDAEFAVYDGRYYRFSLNVSGDPVRATIELEPTDWETVSTAVSTPAANASADVREAIDGGTVTNSTFVVPGVYERGGAHYLVHPANEGEILGNFLALVGGFLFNPIGWAYTVAGLGLLGAFRVRRRARPLDRRTAVLVVPGTLAAMWLGTTLTNTGSLGMRYVLIPGIGVVTAFGLFAGFCIRRGSWKSLVGWSVALAAVVVAADAVAIGLVGTIFGTLGLVVGWFGSLLLVPYGYALASDSEDEREEGPGAVTAEELGDG
ncbi:MULTISPECIES: hypothetical protein [unclassified Haloferax]|uniref:hypothetical protein n=1 Tax=unclassified Haloferax TaxID=2625095 RepID=UPI000E230589|nr:MULTISPECIES: hypothetical protein [unclassified Haloferax]RDZ34749.1 hypothetical protein C5B88_09910 [Haloferax sp. Atlit-24N]RLM35160.1 hypothetical protein DVK03_09920 [Haloferax sp. Atlit-109R]RLM43010.1 hypothetical protein DVK04_09935 [Haloferax sp. Atlit-105R]